ncbi:RNA polymerase rpb4 domain-containing protein [Ditylenchus destructor]|uniref:DNA-directed RNA polymerase III subunit RPC9 n=1 Tax=Ditylenchus destructor TaxID=166010 RepID=A0AAD4R2D3_9BILA|nr:RNA polymerase rpb4 domain-containing protein [Ditylenchus destructor]
MEVVDPRSTLITNQEVLELLTQAKHQMNTKCASKLAESSSKSVVGSDLPENHSTIVYETMTYLNETSPAPSQSRKQNVDLIKALQKAGFKLTAAEVMQIVNLRPKSPVEIQLVIEESEERLTEQQVDEIIRIITAHTKSQPPQFQQPKYFRNLKSPKNEPK